MNATSLSHDPESFAKEQDASLVQRLREGDDEAYEHLVRQYGGRMLSVARRFLGCSDECTDAVQEAFISAFQAIHAFQGTATIATWLHRIVVNACLMKLRSHSRRRTVPLDDLLPAFDKTGHHAQPVIPWSESAVDRLSRAESAAQVRACIEMLPDDYRSILLLRDMEELDTETTAEILGISVPAVKTRLHRARQALRSLLDPMMREEAFAKSS
jgi:RNA polymerase sigma-70 factor, ECF subfamily